MSAPAPSPLALRCEFPSRLENVDAVCQEIRSLLAGGGWPEAAFVVELVARECLNNAVLHGNASDPAKPVVFRLKCAGPQIRLQVTDAGTGRKAPTAAGSNPPSASATSGRGFAILEAYAERIHFNRRGNQITVWLRPSACPQPN